MPLRRLGLRARVILAFGVGALLLSTLLSAVTFSLTRANLLEQREQDVLRNAIANAQGINNELGLAALESTVLVDIETDDETDAAAGDAADAELSGVDAGNRPELVELIDDLLQQFVVPRDSNQGLRMRAQYYWANSVAFNEENLPADLTPALFDDSASEMVFRGPDESFYAVVLPLPFAEASASYIQVASLGEVEDTLAGLRTTLVGASIVTTLLGLGFGIYVVTRIFNPLGEISGAAEQIAEGDLDTRLDAADDPDLDRIVASFNNMTSALQDRIIRDARFASDVSHELRSPLMTLTGSAAVLEKRRDDLPERAQVALDLLTADIRRFKQLVEDLLEISRFDIGAVELDKDEVLVSEFVRQALHAATGGTREVPVIVAPDGDDLIAVIDKRRIAQVIRNLSENADKYADGVTQARIVRFGDDGLRIELEDEGPGVPENERELIFDRFSRGSEGGRRGSSTGVGLGLSLVAEHLRLHGGSIHVTDRVDRLNGARFVIELPGVVVDE